MADGEDGAVGENGLLHDDTDIDGGLSDTPVGDAYFLDETVMLVHQQSPELLYVEVLQLWSHVLKLVTMI